MFVITVNMLSMQNLFFLQVSRGKRSLEKVKQRRKKNRTMKKLFHRSSKYSMETLSLNSLKRRWQERVTHSEALHAIEREEIRRKEQKRENLQTLRDKNFEEAVHRNEQITINDKNYAELSHAYSTVQGSSPLLLDAVVTPISEQEECECSTSKVLVVQCKEQIRRARHERDKAISLARQYRNLAEQSQLYKRVLKSNMEDQIETVRDFWRNKIIEGDSREGRMVRADPD